MQPANVADQGGVVVSHRAAKLDKLSVKPFLVRVPGVACVARLLQHLLHLHLVHGAQARDLGLVLVRHPPLPFVVQATVLDPAVLQPLSKSLLGPQRSLHLPVQPVPDPHQFGVFSLEAGDDLAGIGDSLLNGVLKLRGRDALLQRRSGLVQLLAKSLDLSRVRLDGGCSKSRHNFGISEGKRSKRNKEPAERSLTSQPTELSSLGG